MQHKLANLIGLSLAGLSRRSAGALLYAALAEHLDVEASLPSTDAQREIAKQLELKSLSAFKELAGIQIRAEFVRLNEEAMHRHKFKPGMWVMYVGGPHVNEPSHAVGQLYQVSTVKPDGRIYFKATNGASAYASQLEPKAST